MLSRIKKNFNLLRFLCPIKKLYNDKSQIIQGLSFAKNPFEYTPNNTKSYTNTKTYTSGKSTSTSLQQQYPMAGSIELKKLRKLSFYRDDMVISLQMYKKVVPKYSNTFIGDGYVYIEIKEKDTKYEYGGPKNPRAIVLSPNDIAKILLLQPRSYVDEDVFEKITLLKKNRSLIISQTISNTYEFKIKVTDPNNSNMTISSSIELNAEDIIILKLYMKVKLFLI
jgi:hypothetical protein